MLRPRAGGRGGGEGGDPAGSARRRPRSRLPHVSLRPGPPPYTSGVPRPAARDETEAPQPLPSPPPFSFRRDVSSAGLFFFSPVLGTPPWVTAARSDDAGREEEVGAPRAGGCASGRGTCRRRRRLCGRVRTEERKGRSRGEPKLPPDLTPDPAAAAGRARSAAVSFGAGGGCSFGSEEEGPARAAMLGRAPPEGGDVSSVSILGIILACCEAFGELILVVSI
ncbi:uncharacterized protein AAEQ78_018546 [Lycaon pictus]